MAFETEDHEIQYCFPAFNSSCIKRTRSKYEYNIMYVFFSLLSAWTVFLNLLVIVSISHFKKLHTPTNLLILSLAVADLLIGLIVIPIEAVKLIETCWYFGNRLCGLFSMIFYIILSASLYTLVLIAVDRYVAVCHPLLYPQKITTTRALISIGLCWVCSSTYCTSFVISNGYFSTAHRSDSCDGECFIIISFAWKIVDLTISFLSPSVLMICLYLKIFQVVLQQVKVINSLKGGKRVVERSMRRKSESKAALTLGIIVTVYQLCYIPYCVCSLAVNSSTVINILLWALYFNSGLNPLVYALFYPWFKKTVKHILTLKIFQPSSSLVQVFTEHQL